MSFMVFTPPPLRPQHAVDTKRISKKGINKQTKYSRRRKRKIQNLPKATTPTCQASQRNPRSRLRASAGKQYLINKQKVKPVQGERGGGIQQTELLVGLKKNNNQKKQAAQNRNRDLNRSTGRTTKSQSARLLLLGETIQQGLKIRVEQI